MEGDNDYLRMSNDEIIDKVLSIAKGKRGDSIPVEHIMKSVLGLREPHTIRRILQIMQDNKIGAGLLPGGALLWNENARKISEEGYQNYDNRIKSEENENKEFKKIIKDFIVRGTTLNQHIINVDNISLVGRDNYGEIKQETNSTLSKKSKGKPKWLKWLYWIIGILVLIAGLIASIISLIYRIEESGIS